MRRSSRISKQERRHYGVDGDIPVFFQQIEDNEDLDPSLFDEPIYRTRGKPPRDPGYFPPRQDPLPLAASSTREARQGPDLLHGHVWEEGSPPRSHYSALDDDRGPNFSEDELDKLLDLYGSGEFHYSPSENIVRRRMITHAQLADPNRLFGPGNLPHYLDPSMSTSGRRAAYRVPGIPETYEETANAMLTSSSSESDSARKTWGR